MENAVDAAVVFAVVPLVADVKERACVGFVDAGVVTLQKDPVLVGGLVDESQKAGGAVDEHLLFHAVGFLFYSGMVGRTNLTRAALNVGTHRSFHRPREVPDRLHPRRLDAFAAAPLAERKPRTKVS